MVCLPAPNLDFEFRVSLVIKLLRRSIFDIYQLVASKFINKVVDNLRVFVTR